MIVTKEPIILTLPESKKPRTPGIHQSAIIRCIATESGILKPEWCEELSLVDFRQVTDQKAIVRMCIGIAWEEWYIPQIPDVIDHPDEVLYDGVYMSMDGKSVSVVLNLPQNTFRARKIVHEVKATSKSPKTVGLLDDDLLTRRKNWMWLAQLMGYCIAEDTDCAALHVLFIHGNYKWPFEPQLWRYNIQFSKEELTENWQFQKEYLKDLTHRLQIEGVK